MLVPGGEVVIDVADGMLLPESPVWLENGDVLVTEVRRGVLIRVSPNGQKSVVADLGGGPNGAAIGPDGQVYICNNGGSVWYLKDGKVHGGTPSEDISQGPNYTGGRIERVDLKTGAWEVLLTEAGGIPLRAPNDIIFDHTGGFWLTDYGKKRSRERDRTGVLYATPIGTSNKYYTLTEKIFPLNCPNGIGLSPDGGTLYVAETETAQLLSWSLSAPGVIAGGLDPYAAALSAHRVAGMGDGSMFDSLAVDSEGNIAIGTLVTGGINVFDPRGNRVERIDTRDSGTTNIAFGGPDLRTAYITCGATGRLCMTQWQCPGLPLAFKSNG